MQLLGNVSPEPSDHKEQSAQRTSHLVARNAPVLHRRDDAGLVRLARGRLGDEHRRRAPSRRARRQTHSSERRRGRFVGRNARHVRANAKRASTKGRPRAKRSARHAKQNAKNAVLRVRRNAPKKPAPQASMPLRPRRIRTAPEAGSQSPKVTDEARPLTAGHRQCALTAETSSAEIALGETVTISGKLSCPSASEAGEQQVTIYTRETNGSGAGLTIAGTATTEPDGSVEPCRRPAQRQKRLRRSLGERGARGAGRRAGRRGGDAGRPSRERGIAADGRGQGSSADRQRPPSRARFALKKPTGRSL